MKQDAEEYEDCPICESDTSVSLCVNVAYDEEYTCNSCQFSWIKKELDK